MIQFFTPAGIPFAPALKAALTHGGMLLILSVIHANHLADVRGCGVRVWQRTLINQGDLPAARAQFEGGSETKAAATENEQS